MTNVILKKPDEINSDTDEEGVSSTPIQPPIKLRRDISLSTGAKERIRSTRGEIDNILQGHDADRLVVVCGPCSIDDVNSALIYGERLRRLAEEVEERIVIVMRTYFEKPRSVVGWKGMLYDPLSEVKCGPTAGLTLARRLVVRLSETGLPCATEFLNPLLSYYLEDCMAYGSIGSRTVESQIHRELASRLNLPVGMKNAMDGNPDSAINAVKSARSAHCFFGQNLSGDPCLIETSGNKSAHVILRGGTLGPNYSEQVVGDAVDRGNRLGLKRPVVIDCSHGNSTKDHRKQPIVAGEIVRQWKEGQRGIAGLMLESHLVEGRQDTRAGEIRRFGQSITDACIGWGDTEKLVRMLAENL